MNHTDRLREKEAKGSAVQAPTNAIQQLSQGLCSCSFETRLLATRVTEEKIGVPNLILPHFFFFFWLVLDL